ncbi:hypothetical protein J7K25_00850 [bacterium]|nr:hypothetical protein [bacterium]
MKKILILLLLMNIGGYCKHTLRDKIKVKLLEKIGTETEIQHKLEEKVITETDLKREKERIIREVVEKYAKEYAEKIKPIHIPIVKIEKIIVEITQTPYIKFLTLSPREIRIWKQKIESIGIEGLSILISEIKETEIPKLAVIISKTRAISIPKFVILIEKIPIEDIEKLAIIINRTEAISIPELAVLIQEIPVNDIEKIAVLLTEIETLDVSKLARQLNKITNFYISEQEFYEAWRKKDVREMAKLLKQIKAKEIPFFLAWGNYKNFDQIDWDREEEGFDYRQVLVSSISYDWRDKFKPEKEIILTVNYGLNNVEIKALLDLIVENKSKIRLIILPWGRSKVNNFDNRDVSTYKEVGEWCDKLFYSIKEVAPEIPVYLTVCFTPTMDEWIRSFKAPYNGLALWNITNTFKANLKKVYDIISKYNENIILSGIFQCQPDKFWIDFETAKKITFETYNRVRVIGFKGIILMTNK